MRRIGCATVCCVSLLALATTAAAGPVCNGVPGYDVLELPNGSWILIGERCLERDPGDVPPSEFDSDTVHTLGDVNLSDVTRIEPIVDLSDVPLRPDPWP